ncbi:hypothetical protein O181_002362, partial [Austropuccinia psidii MF-1]|nr:hypothetical protein [Austropuccinia psidii MF-1]
TETSRRGGVKSRRSRSFYGLLGGYPEISQGPRSRLGEAEDEEAEDSVEVKSFEETEVAASFAGVTEASVAPYISHFNKPIVFQSEPNFLKMMEKMTQLMGQLTLGVSTSDDSRAPEFKNPLMKEPDYFDGTQAHKLRAFIQFCQLIFHNDPENFFSDRKKVLLSLV